jgi:hypothetical protein
MSIGDCSHKAFSNSERLRWTGLVTCLVMSLLSFSCSRQHEEAMTGAAYPQPRYPRYLVNPDMDDLLIAARVAVSQPTGRAPLGKMQSGQNIYVFIQWGQDMRVWEAVKQAWDEKGVEAHAIGIWDVMGITKEDYDKRMELNIVHGNEGWKEAGIFLRRDYRQYFSEEIQNQFGDPIVDFQIIDPYLIAYFDKHPEIENIYAGIGGGNFFVSWIGEKHAAKFQGNWIYYRPVDLLSKAAEFPADVWNLVDEKILRPVPFVSEVTFQDPEGTNLHWSLTPEQSQLWGRNSGGSNHIYVYPNPLYSTLQEGGVLAAHANHTGIFPTMTVYLDRYGSVESIEGGGRNAELFRMMVENPLFKEAKLPKSPAPGYWFFRQDGFATNPKFTRSLPALVEGESFLPNASERNRAGIQHLAFSYDSDDPEDLAYAEQRGIPLGDGQHNSHMHVYFPTIQWKLRDTGEWLTVGEKGYVTMFDDPEVRALAARYGGPDLLFRYEWNPSIPGVNVGGEYEKDFAQDPWNWIMAEWEQIQAGTYEYFVEDYSLDNPVAALDAGRP